MSQYPDSYAEVSYSAQDLAAGTFAQGRIDLASFDPGRPGGALLLNEIRRTKDSADALLKIRERDINVNRITFLSIPGVPRVGGNYQTQRDERGFSGVYELLGVTVRANRDGAGIITYSYTPGGVMPPIARLLEELRKQNQRMRDSRDANRAGNQEAWDAGKPVSISTFAKPLVVGVGFAAFATAITLTAPVWLTAGVVGGIGVGACATLC